MRFARPIIASSAFRWPVTVVLAALAAVTLPFAAAFAQTLQDDGSIKIGNKTLRCGEVRTVLDRSLPMEGAAVLGEALILNPFLLQRHSQPVRTFIYFHECAHHTVGGSELGADCWAVDRGVRDGWLDRPSLESVCRSFVKEPASDTHPSGPERCRNLDMCFATALKRWPQSVVAQVQTPQSPKVAAAIPPLPARAPPRLVQRPTLVSIGLSAEASTRHGLRAVPSFVPDEAAVAWASPQQPDAPRP